VKVKGTNRSTRTDFDGNFFIDVNQNDILIISYDKFPTQEFTIGSQTYLTILLQKK
jgi:hypothetical protein